MRNVVGEIISSITMWKIVIQLDKNDFSCGLVVNHLKVIKLFSDQITEIALTKFLLGAAGIVPPCRI